MGWWEKYTEEQVEQAIANALAGGSSASLIHQASRTLTHAETIALPTYNGANMLSISDPPGEGKIIVLKPALWLTFYPAIVDYGNINGLQIRLLLEDSGGSYFQTGVWIGNDFLAGGYSGGLGPDFGAFRTLSSTEFLDVTQNRGQIENKGLAIYGTSNDNSPLTGGDIDNRLTFDFEFRVWDTAQKKFLTTDESGWNPDTRTFDA